MPAAAPADKEEFAFYALLRCPLCPERPVLTPLENQDWRCTNNRHTFTHKDGFLALRPGDELFSETSS